jgi:hypothetical protein
MQYCWGLLLGVLGRLTRVLPASEKSKKEKETKTRKFAKRRSSIVANGGRSRRAKLGYTYLVIAHQVRTILYCAAW